MDNLTTNQIFRRLQEMQLLYALLTKMQNTLVIPCELPDDDLMALSEIGGTISEYQEEVDERIFYLSRELTERLQASIDAVDAP